MRARQVNTGSRRGRRRVAPGPPAKIDMGGFPRDRPARRAALYIAPRVPFARGAVGSPPPYDRAARCRSIKTLFNFEPPATDEEIRAASLQFVRKLSGFNAPSKANAAVFEASVEEVFQVARRLVGSLVTMSPPRNREEEAAKAKALSAARFTRVG